jgi:hypothetical protein
MLLCKLSLEYKDEYQGQSEVGRIKILYVSLCPDSYLLTLHTVIIFHTHKLKRLCPSLKVKKHIRHYFGTYWCLGKKHFFENRTNKFLGDQFLPKMEQRLKKWNSKSSGLIDVSV